MDWRLKRKETERETFFVRMPERRKGGHWGRPFSFPAGRWAVGDGKTALGKFCRGCLPARSPIAHRPACFQLNSYQSIAKAISKPGAAGGDRFLIAVSFSSELIAAVLPLTGLRNRASLPRTRAPHRMPNLSGGSATPSSQSTVREFVDGSGKLWSVVLQGDALIFTAIDVTRGGTRAITVDLNALDDSVSDDALRAWLNDAPRIGTLS